MKKMRISFAFIMLVVLGIFLVYQEGSLPVDKKNQGTVYFTVQKGEGLNSIVKNLKAQDLIRNRVAFYVTVKRLGIEKKIQAGDFRLSKRMSAEELANELTHGTSDMWITFIEGLRKEEMVAILNESGNENVTMKEFTEKAKEGYMFPDTYRIPKDASVDTIVSVMRNNFDAKFSDSLRNGIQKKGLDERQGVIVASLVEREAQFPEDKKTVAGILIKRYKNDWALQLDATIQYAIGYQKLDKTWWKKELSVDDLKADSTYNTYVYPGLPPAPICNPGLESLEAIAAAQTDTPYWYYISDKKGVMHYAVTLEEHNSNIDKYLN